MLGLRSRDLLGTDRMVVHIRWGLMSDRRDGVECHSHRDDGEPGRLAVEKDVISSAGAPLMPRPATLEGRVHHSESQVAAEFGLL